jgi:hypothetical protein
MVLGGAKVAFLFSTEGGEKREGSPSSIPFSSLWNPFLRFSSYLPRDPFLGRKGRKGEGKGGGASSVPFLRTRSVFRPKVVRGKRRAGRKRGGKGKKKKGKKKAFLDFPSRNE